MAAETTPGTREHRAGNEPRARTELQVAGMTCGHCARRVAEALQGVSGVESATVKLEAGQATVTWRQGAPAVAAAVAAVQDAGFKAKAVRGGEPTRKRLLGGWGVNLLLGMPATGLLLLGGWGLRLGMEPWFQWFSLLVAGLVQVVAGARFYRGAWGQLKTGRSNMDTLVALGSSTAFAYSTWVLCGGQRGHVYFLEAAAILTLISLGHWLESEAGARASSALRRLLDLAPALARRIDPDGRETEVALDALTIGDTVVLRPGDRVPTDGHVLAGDSAVDESMLTGESAPVDKTRGHPLYAGTVNLSGRLTMRVTAMGDETALAHIIAAVQRAQNSRANIQRLGDRVSSVFVPVVVCIAVAAGLWWGLAPASANQAHAWLERFLWPSAPPALPLAAALITAAAVLIVACPCAMGLATPAAIMAGSNAAAARGILIRDGVALEKAGRITSVVFDKTGTLTLGKPRVIKIWEPSPGQWPLAQLAATLAHPSTHPISQALAQLAPERLPQEGWIEIHGAGLASQVQAQAGGGATRHPARTARLGSLRWLAEQGVDLAPGQAFVDEWSAQGATLVGLAIESSLAGLFALRDTIKTGSPDVVRQLQREGLQVFLVTGDHPGTAASIARQVGIPPRNVSAGVRPEQKAAFVKNLQQGGHRVAFVGDGINDAPALEQADLGIAVSRASDIAREAADLILLKSEIEAVPESLSLARATLRTIRQNLFWAFFYNAVGIPLAALGFMSPVLCAAAMGLSDLVVIGNALRLGRWRRKGASAPGHSP